MRLNVQSTLAGAKRPPVVARSDPDPSFIMEAADGYRLWAPTYSDETAISLIENRLVADLGPPPGGRRLLDAGCGTGRRLREVRAAVAVGIDRSPEMIAAGRVAWPDSPCVVGDVRDLALPDSSFDLLWCRLVLGHLKDIEQAYCELGRVAEPGATLIVTDFHPEAYRAGHRRTFRRDGRLIEVAHYVHRQADHCAAAARAGLALVASRDACVGEEVREHYERAGKADWFAAQRSLPLVLGLSFRKER